MSSWNGDYDEQAMTDTRQALEEAWETICQRDRSFRRWACAIADERGTTNAGRFARFLDAEAWTDAALCLVPEGWQADVTHYSSGEGSVLLSDDRVNPVRLPDIYHVADTPALAIAQAALRAKEAGDV